MQTLVAGLCMLAHAMMHALHSPELTAYCTVADRLVSCVNYHCHHGPFSLFLFLLLQL